MPAKIFSPLKQKDLPMNSESSCYDNTLKEDYISILVLSFLGSASSPRDMVMWSKSSMYLVYCGAYLFTASHHVLEGNVPIIFPCVCIFLFCL